MRLSLLAVPALFALVAATGCNSAQRVKYDVDGNAVAVEEPTYTPANPSSTASTPAVEVMKPAPAPAPAPVAAPTKPAPAPVAEQPVKEAPVKAAEPKEPKHTTKAAHGEAGKPGGTYTVQKGDTLQKISQKVYGTTKKWPAIMKANHMASDKIVVGQKLALPEAK